MSAEVERRGRFRGLFSRTFPHAKDMIELLFGAILMFVGIVGCVLIQEQLSLMWFQTAIMQQQLIISERDKRSTGKDTERLLKAYEKLANAGKDAADAELLGAQNSARIAKASEGSIEATRDALRLEQRAWLTITSVTLAPLTVAQAPKVTVEITNSGRSPALDATVRGTVMSRDALRPEDLQLSNKPMVSNLVIAPGTVMVAPIQASEPLKNDSYVDAIRNGPYRMYVRGVITYKDIFRVPHHTTFCFWTGGEALSAGTMNACDRYNDAD